MFNNWQELLGTITIGSVGYILLVILLRIFGKRTLAKSDAFDFIITVAFGSILGSLLLSKDVSLIQGLLGFGVLLFFQVTLSWLTARFAGVRSLVKAKPTLLLYMGKLQEEALKRERVSGDEVLAAVRSKGIAALEDVEAVVLETDSSLSVIAKVKGTSASALVNVAGYSQEFAEETANAIA